jgi:PAS domain-containing protein
VIDDAGRFVDVENAAADLFGTSRAELIGRNARTFCAPGFESWYDDVLEMLAHVGMIATGWQIYRDDHTRQYVDLTIVKEGAGSRLHRAWFHIVPADHRRGWFGAPSHEDVLLPSADSVLREARERRIEHRSGAA